MPFLHLPAIALWLVLMVAGYGAQSLGNLGEGVILGGMAVAGGYAKVLLVDRHTTKPLATSLALAALLMLGAVALRSFMPLIPE